ncbi:site-2 protease family protein [Candidatus Margulisiibacteriota bacterium]
MFGIEALIIRIPVILIALVIHEFAHAKSADMLGDPTPRYAGRLTLNPIPHIDPIGLLMLMVVRIGWAKPVPINPNNFKDPRTGSAIVSLAGPISNFFSAWLVASLIRLLPFPILEINQYLTIFLINFVWISVALGVFNLLPIPPLDGSHILELFISPQTAYMLRQYGFMILIFILVFPGTGYLLFAVINSIVKLLLPMLFL